MKSVDGWWVPNHMHSPGNHLRRSAVIDLAVAHLPMSRRRIVAQAGGHLGIWPSALAEYFQHVFTWEPMLENVECLRLNVAPRTNVFITQGCLGDENRLVDMEYCARNTGKHCVARTTKQAYSSAKMERLDDRPELRVLDALFLDVEGFEYNVLVGAKKLVAEHRPLLVLERNGLDRRYGQDGTAVDRFLSANDYVKADTFEEDVIYVQENWK